MRTLAVTGKVVSAHDIPNADRIHALTVFCGDFGTWRGVSPKTILPEDMVVVFMQDALFPEDDERFQFLSNIGYRVRMCRFKGSPSECLIMPNDSGVNEIGVPVDEIYRVKKYVKQVPEGAEDEYLAAFPTALCPITDEDNFQAAPDKVSMMATDPYYITEKADGTSCTVWTDDSGLHVCNRTLELREFSLSNPKRSSQYWRAARKYGLDRLDRGVFLQFEVIGLGVNKNPFRLNELEIRVFSAYDENKRKYLPYDELKSICHRLNLPMARLIGEFPPLGRVPDSDELQKMAEIKYASGKNGEGIVIRALSSEWSFKVINLLYKD